MGGKVWLGVGVSALLLEGQGQRQAGVAHLGPSANVPRAPQLRGGPKGGDRRREVSLLECHGAASEEDADQAERLIRAGRHANPLLDRGVCFRELTELAE